MLYLLCVSYSIYKFVLFLKSITKLVKHCNKNDEIKACVVELETVLSRENGTKELLYGSYMGFSGQTHMGMPISALNGAGCRHTHVGLPRWVTHNSVVRKIRIHMYVPISNLISS